MVPVPSVIESPKQTIVFFGGFEYTSIEEIIYQWSILFFFEIVWLYILFPSSIKEYVLDFGWPVKLLGVSPK